MASPSSLRRHEQATPLPRFPTVREHRRDMRRVAGPGGATALVAAAALVAVSAWLPFLHLPLSSDESGFLLVAQHWHAGSSLYGPYWVDRPPLLLELFSLAGRFGPIGRSPAGLIAPSVKLLGAVASGLAVALVAVLAHVVAPGRRWTRRAAVVAAVALLSDPLLGMPETNGEVLAVPFVLAGVACLLAGLRLGGGRRALLLTATAGAAAMSAALVKQNVVDVFVFAVVLLGASGGRLPHRGRHVAAFLGASGGVLAAALAAAALRGTTPAGLWDAVVVFRLQASAVISASASAATSERMGRVALALAASGAIVLLIVAAGAVLHELLDRPAVARRARTADRGLETAGGWAALAMGAWELCAVALGGSYWLHYLTGTVPAVLLLLVLVRPSRRRRRLLELAVWCAALVSAVVWGLHLTAAVPMSEDAPVIAYLQAHAEPRDGVVVAFGHPDIVAGSGLASPYEHLWSLPVRVRDPRLRELSAVLISPAAPRWVVAAGDSLGSWGLDATAAEAVLRQRYVERTSYGVWHVWQSTAGGAGR